MNLQERIDKLWRHITNGTLLRQAWGDGQERACLLSALAPEVIPPGGHSGSYTRCPAEVMPYWLAEITPDIDDRGSDAVWPEMVRRYARLAAEWHKLDDAAWDRIKSAFVPSNMVSRASTLAYSEVPESDELVAARSAMHESRLCGEPRHTYYELKAQHVKQLEAAKLRAQDAETNALFDLIEGELCAVRLHADAV